MSFGECPLRRAGTVRDHKKGVCLFVELRDGESQEHLLTRFRQTMQRTGILREAKRRRHFVSRSEVRRLARAKAVRRARKHAERPSTRSRPSR